MPFLKKQQSFHKKEIYELINSIFWKHEPVSKAFILGAEDSPTEEEIAAYRQAHPHTSVVLNRKDCGIEWESR